MRQGSTSRLVSPVGVVSLRVRHEDWSESGGFHLAPAVLVAASKRPNTRPQAIASSNKNLSCQAGAVHTRTPRGHEGHEELFGALCAPGLLVFFVLPLWALCSPFFISASPRLGVIRFLLD